jgi:hypothetical protein
MAFVKGQSGNPVGRKPGTKNRRTLVGEALEARSEDVAKAVIAAALDGDMQAAKLVLERVKPPLRDEGPRVKFTFDPSMSLTAQAQHVLQVCAEGEMDVDTCKVLLGCITALGGLMQTDELAARIAALEAAANDNQQATAPGGVLQQGNPA